MKDFFRGHCTSLNAVGVLLTVFVFSSISCSHSPPKSASQASSSPSQTEDMMGIRLHYDRKVLKNGLTVIVVEDRTTPVVEYQTWYRVGSVDERRGLTGLAHLFEHLMFKGTQKYGPKLFFEKLESKGAEVNAYTTRDYTVFHETFTPALFDQVAEMEADRMTGLALDDVNILTEKQVVLEERRMRVENNPGGKIQEAIWNLAFEEHPYQWPVIGYPDDVLRASVDQIREFYHRNYTPSNALIVVVGNVSATKVFSVIEKNYASIPAKSRPSRNIPNEPEQKEERQLILYDKVAAERFSEAYRIPSALDDDSYSLDVLANILFEGTSSRAYKRIVEEKDLALGVGGTAYTPAFPGLFIISGNMKPGIRSEVAEQELNQLFKEVQEKGVTPHEVQVAVRQLTVQTVDSVRTPSGLARLIGTVTTILGDPERFRTDLAKYLKVTPQDVQRVALKYIDPNHRTRVILAPESRRTAK